VEKKKNLIDPYIETGFLFFESCCALVEKMAFKLYTPKENPRGLAAQIVAQYAGVEVVIAVSRTHYLQSSCELKSLMFCISSQTEKSFLHKLSVVDPDELPSTWNSSPLASADAANYKWPVLQIGSFL